MPDHEKSEASAVAEPRRSRAERGAKPNAPRAGRAMPRAAVNSEPQGGTATRVVKVRRGRRVAVGNGHAGGDKRQVRALLLAATEPSSQIEALFALGLTGADLEKLTSGKSRKTIAAWRRGEASPRAELADRLDDARYAGASLLDDHVAFGPAELVAWLRTRSARLGGRRPLEAVADGDFELVINAGQRFARGE